MTEDEPPKDTTGPSSTINTRNVPNSKTDHDDESNHNEKSVLTTATISSFDEKWPSTPTPPPPPPPLLHPERISFEASLRSKSTPFTLKSWIALSLTLDGRDKLTKVIQYSSRLVGYYYENLARRASDDGGEESSSSSYGGRARRFRNLQRGLTQSRKAYRFGRSLIELEKLRDCGILPWILYRPSRHCDGVDDGVEPSGDEGDGDGDGDGGRKTLKSKLTLPHSVSSNIGWGPSSSNHTTTTTTTSSRYRYTRQLSSFLYRSLSNRNDYDPSLLKSSSKTPTWKMVLSIFKLVGLMGFWAGDNVSYLHATGFLPVDDDDEGKNEKKMGGGDTTVGKGAAVFATRSYFFASVSGLLLNVKEWIRHRNGPLRDALDRLLELDLKMRKGDVDSGDGGDGDGGDDGDNVALREHRYMEERRKILDDLEKIKKKHFTICLALLKSCCDVIVFSNNPGVDFHKKYRGKKMNEGIQCICGITSAMTVLYNNFPNSKNPK